MVEKDGASGAGREPDLSLDDAIDAAWSEQNAGAEVETEDGAMGPEAEAAEQDTEIQAVDDVESEGSDLSSDGAQDSEGDGGADTSQNGLIEAPGHWTKEDREAFAKLDPAARNILLARDKALESAATKKSMELADEAKFAADVRALFDEDIKQQLVQAGMNEIGALKQLTDLQKWSAQDPAAYIEWFAAQNRIDLADYAPRQDSEPDVDQDDLSEFDFLDRSAIQPLEEKLVGLEQRLDQEARQREQNAQLAMRRAVNTEIETFQNATDDNGNLLHPHYKAVETLMASYITASPQLQAIQNPQERLRAAYEQVIHALPEYREKTQAQIQEQARQEAVRKMESAKAKRAKGPTYTRAPAPERPETVPDLDETIKTQMNEAGYNY